MSERDDGRKKVAVYNPAVPASARWAKKASEVRGPLSAWTFGIAARANMRAMQDAMAQAKVFGQFMEVSAQTIAQTQRAEDALRAYAIRRELGAEVYQNEIERQRDQFDADRHDRAIAARHRQVGLIKGDTEILMAQQTKRAKKKFESFKHAVGEERFKTEAARRKVGAAEARMAMGEAGASPDGGSAHTGDAARPTENAYSAFISERLERVRDRLKELRADGEDSEERTHLASDEASLERMLADLLKPR